MRWVAVVLFAAALAAVASTGWCQLSLPATVDLLTFKGKDVGDVTVTVEQTSGVVQMPEVCATVTLEPPWTVEEIHYMFFDSDPAGAEPTPYLWPTVAPGETTWLMKVDADWESQYWIAIHATISQPGRDLDKDGVADPVYEDVWAAGDLFRVGRGRYKRLWWETYFSILMPDDPYWEW